MASLLAMHVEGVARSAPWSPGWNRNHRGPELHGRSHRARSPRDRRRPPPFDRTSATAGPAATRAPPRRRAEASRATPACARGRGRPNEHRARPSPQPQAEQHAAQRRRSLLGTVVDINVFRFLSNIASALSSSWHQSQVRRWSLRNAQRGIPRLTSVACASLCAGSCACSEVGGLSTGNCDAWFPAIFWSCMGIL